MIASESIQRTELFKATACAAKCTVSGMPGMSSERRSPRNRIFGWSHVALFATAFVISQRALADKLPAPYSFVSASGGQGSSQVAQGPYSTTVTTAYSGTNIFGTSYSNNAHAEADLEPDPTLLLNVGGTNGGTITPGAPGATGFISYFVSVAAPAGSPTSTIVPVNVVALILFHGTPDASFRGSGSVQIGTTFVSICPKDSTIYPECYLSGDSKAKLSQTIGFQPGVRQNLGMSADISYVSTISPTFSAMVDVDPIFTIDPTFLQSNPGYSLDFSDGVGNSTDVPLAPTPEPSSVVMLGTGVLGLAAVFRRRLTLPDRNFASHL